VQLSEPLRNPVIAAALDGALSGNSGPFFSQVCRFSGLPGPRPNWKLAWSVGYAIAAAGPRGDRLLTELVSLDLRRAPAGTVEEFLPLIAALSLGARFLNGAKPAPLLRDMRLLAEDARHLVREAVVVALGEMGRSRGDELVPALASWTDGYLSATVALQALTQRHWLDAMKSPTDMLLRFDEAFSLVEAATRSDQRSQGYRALVKSLAEAPARAMDRFPDETLAWIATRVATSDVELHATLGTYLEKARARGHGPGRLENVEGQLQAAAPPRRDPKTYVGPTRQRGAKRR